MKIEELILDLARIRATHGNITVMIQHADILGAELIPADNEFPAYVNIRELVQ